MTKHNAFFVCVAITQEILRTHTHSFHSHSLAKTGFPHIHTEREIQLKDTRTTRYETYFCACLRSFSFSYDSNFNFNFDLSWASTSANTTPYNWLCNCCLLPLLPVPAPTYPTLSYPTLLYSLTSPLFTPPAACCPPQRDLLTFRSVVCSRFKFYLQFFLAVFLAVFFFGFCLWLARMRNDFFDSCLSIASWQHHEARETADWLREQATKINKSE